jgi:protein-ribulosamine 3-kinase
MRSATSFQIVERAIRAVTGGDFRIRKIAAAGGGCINSAYCLEGDGRRFFVKLNCAELLSMFEAECEGLREIAATKTVRAPEPVCYGMAGDRAYLVMEFLDLRSARSSADRLLGQRLAAMHEISQPYFGWRRDNTIGSTRQPNPPSQDWTDFWARRRLGFQLQLAADRGYRGGLQSKGQRLLESLPVLFEDHRPRPSLLHGDLWGGNYACDETGQPVLFDPACYYGDREADLAMTELFGGFGGDFYAAYREVFPLDAGYAVRKILYNLYHVLNHLNLFGGGYLGQAEGMMDRLLAEFS